MGDGDLNKKQITDNRKAALDEIKDTQKEANGNYPFARLNKNLVLLVLGLFGACILIAIVLSGFARTRGKETTKEKLTNVAPPEFERELKGTRQETAKPDPALPDEKENPYSRREDFNTDNRYTRNGVYKEENPSYRNLQTGQNSYRSNPAN